jgi:hypothetical protein
MLDRRSLSYYNVKAKSWAATPGVFDIFVGASSAPSAVELRGKLTLTN